MRPDIQISGSRSVIVALVAVGLAVAALVTFGAWRTLTDPKPGQVWGTKLGVSETVSGQLLVRVLTCPGEHVTKVQLFNSNRAGDLDSPDPLWEIAGVSESDANSLVVGSTPIGFREFVPLQAAALQAANYLFFAVRTDGPAGSFGADFSRDDPRLGTIYIGGPGLLGSNAHVTEQKFMSVRSKLCKLQPHGPGG
jgi:hypothetical protein